MNDIIIDGAFKESQRIIKELQDKNFTINEIVLTLNLMGQQISYIQGITNLKNTMQATKQTMKETIKELEEGK